MTCYVANWNETSQLTAVLGSHRFFMGKSIMSNSRKRLKGHELFYFTTCEHCIKVRLTLWWMGLELPLKDITFHPKNKAELIAGGGKKQVPCLRIEDERDGVRWMYESSDIIRYLKQQLAN
jgi:glutaredoxin